MNDKYKQELTDQFVDVVEHLNRLMHSGRLDEWQGLDMTIPQIKTLVLLENIGSAKMSVISAYLGSALSATTSIVDRMVQRNLVNRVADPNDRRVVMCELTPHGRKATERFWRIGRERAQRMADILTGEQLESVVRALELIRQTGERIPGTFGSTHSTG